MRSGRWKKLQRLLARWPIADHGHWGVAGGAQDSTGLDVANVLWVKDKVAGSL